MLTANFSLRRQGYGIRGELCEPLYHFHCVLIGFLKQIAYAGCFIVMGTCYILVNEWAWWRVNHTLSYLYLKIDRYLC